MTDRDKNVFSLQKARGERELRKLLKGHKPIKPEIDLTKIEKVKYDTFVLGRKKNSNNELHIIVNDVSDGYVHKVGVIRLTAAQWKKLKHEGNMMLRFHFGFLKKNKKRSK